MAQNHTISTQVDKLDIVFAEGKKGKRTRKVISRSNDRVTRKFPSILEDRMIYCESELERDAYRIQEVDHSIRSYQEQPACITYSIDGDQSQHYPDFLLRTKQGLVFREIKTEEEANTLEIRRRTEYLSQQLPFYGYQYEVLTDTTIHQQPRLKNARFLLRRGRKPVVLQQYELLRLYAKKKGYLFWGDIVTSKSCPLNVFEISWLILNGYVKIPMNQRWQDETPLTLVESTQAKEV